MSTDPPQGRQSRLIGFECRVCETRLHARPEHVGHKIRCPDCGAANPVPPPREQRPSKPPPAMEGEQYEPWPLDQQPTGAELRAAEPKSIGFACSLCGTRLYAPPDQANEVIECPDCGAKTRVPPYEERAESATWREDDGEELDLDVVSVEPRRTASIPGVTDLERGADDADAPVDRDEAPEYSTRPKLPPWPLQTKILLFPLSRGLPVRIVLFGAWAAGAVWLAYFGLGFLQGYGAIIAMFLLAGSAILVTMCLASLAACWLTIITESSEGNDVIEAWPDIVFLDWMFDGLYIIMAALVSCVPGWVVSLLWPDEPLVRVAVIFGGAIVCFPIVLLSMLDIGSPLAPISPKILGSFARAPGSWLMFLAESGVLLALVGAAGLLLLQQVALGLVFWIPLAVLASIWYARLLGRLAWVLAETTLE